MIDRRGAGRLLALGAMVMLLGGHTPYGQWVVYRRKHLLIGCHRGDPVTNDLAKLTVRILEEHLPEAQARVARAPNAGRLASLLGTDQMEVAILAAEDAVAMSRGEGRFAPYGQVSLLTLAPVFERVLVSRGDFPARHAWLVTAALSGLFVSRVQPAAPVPWHPGSIAFIDGRPQPIAD